MSIPISFFTTNQRSKIPRYRGSWDPEIRDDQSLEQAISGEDLTRNRREVLLEETGMNIG